MSELSTRASHFPYHACKIIQARSLRCQVHRGSSSQVSFFIYFNSLCLFLCFRTGGGGGGGVDKPHILNTPLILLRFLHITEERKRLIGANDNLMNGVKNGVKKIPAGVRQYPSQNDEE